MELFPATLLLSIGFFLKPDAPITQLVEWRSYEPQVGGSRPPRSIIVLYARQCLIKIVSFYEVSILRCCKNKIETVTQIVINKCQSHTEQGCGVN